MQLVSVLTRCPDDQWRLQGRATWALPGYFCKLYNVICLNVLLHCACACIPCPYRRRDVARGHGLWRSWVNLESVEARSVHSHLCLPGLLLVSAGACADDCHPGCATVIRLQKNLQQ